jgi:GMP synthase (glutamine-hydrolysing)
MFLNPPDPNAEKILVVLHQQSSSAARIGRMLLDMGYVLDERRPSCGDCLPKTLDDHAGAIIFGGPMSANDNDDYIRREIDFVGTVLKSNKPLLGICLGAQMIARHLGERVAPHPDGHTEIGYYPLEATPAGDALCTRQLPRHVYQWHKEGFDLPRGADLLARGGDFPIQAFKYGSAVALQFHPEVCYSTICRWTTRGCERMNTPGAQDRETHFDGWFRFDATIARWTRTFLGEWIAPQAAMA